jgi:hypothetical protein
MIDADVWIGDGIKRWNQDCHSRYLGLAAPNIFVIYSPSSQIVKQKNGDIWGERWYIRYISHEAMLQNGFVLQEYGAHYPYFANCIFLSKGIRPNI